MLFILAFMKAVGESDLRSKTRAHTVTLEGWMR